MGNVSWKALEGQVVGGDYHLLSVIGIDEDGAVFRAEQNSADRRRVAVRLMPAGDAAQEARLRELAAAGARHPNLIECFGAGQWQPADQPFFYVAVELATQQLSDLIKHWPLAVHQAREVVQGVAAALGYLHGGAVPVVHQGVRPADVMLVGRQWKLSDFGAVPAGGPLRTEQFRETLTYRPPEQSGGRILPAGDMWSLGVLIVRALTGTLPTSGEPGAGMDPAARANTPPAKGPLPPPFDDIIAGCLKPDPDSRWTARQVLERVGPPPPPVPGGLLMDDYRWVAWAVAGLALFALAVVGGFVILSGPSEDVTQQGGARGPQPTKFLTATPPGASPGATGSASRYQAKLIKRVEPEYPSAARAARISGTVRLRLTVDRHGGVRDCRVVSGPPLLASAAIRAAFQWQFEPLIQNGQPVTFETEIDVHFPLR